MIDLPPMNYGQTIEAVSHCGIPRPKVQIRYEAETQLDVVSIEPLSETPSDDLIRCVYNATVLVGYDVQFTDTQQNETFWRFVLEEGRRRARLEGEEWLRQRGLLENMPRYDANRSNLPEFGRQVESFCGLEPGSAVELFEEDLFTPRADFMQALAQDPNSGLSDKFICLMNVFAASNLTEGGVRFGFIGNEAILSEGGDE